MKMGALREILHQIYLCRYHQNKTFDTLRLLKPLMGKRLTDYKKMENCELVSTIQQFKNGVTKIDARLQKILDHLEKIEWFLEKGMETDKEVSGFSKYKELFENSRLVKDFSENYDLSFKRASDLK